MPSLRTIGTHAGRIGLASLFLLGGANKIISFSATAARMEEVGLAPAVLLLPATIALELIAGSILALNTRFASLAALALAAFTLATNVFFHPFWAITGELRALELSLFFKNVAIAGALVLAACMLGSGEKVGP